MRGKSWIEEIFKDYYQNMIPFLQMRKQRSSLRATPIFSVKYEYADTSVPPMLWNFMTRDLEECLSSSTVSAIP